MFRQWKQWRIFYRGSEAMIYASVARFIIHYAMNAHNNREKNEMNANEPNEIESAKSVIKGTNSKREPVDGGPRRNATRQMREFSSKKNVSNDLSSGWVMRLCAQLRMKYPLAINLAPTRRKSFRARPAASMSGSAALGHPFFRVRIHARSPSCTISSARPGFFDRTGPAQRNAVRQWHAKEATSCCCHCSTWAKSYANDKRMISEEQTIACRNACK